MKKNGVHVGEPRGNLRKEGSFRKGRGWEGSVGKGTNPYILEHVGLSHYGS